MTSAREDLQQILSRGHTVEEVARACDVFAGILEQTLRGEPLDGGSTSLERLLRVLARDVTDSSFDDLLAMPVHAWRADVPSAVAWPAFISFLPELRAEGYKFAIGGARALELHGAHRDTNDVDLFFTESSRRALQLFRDRGCSVGYFAGDHLVARPPGSTQVDDVIDVHFPIVEPARSAIRRAVEVEVDGVMVPVLPAASVVAAKLMSASGLQNEDAFMALNAGVITPRRVATELKRVAHLPRVQNRFRRILDDVDGAFERLQLWGELGGRQC